MKVYLDTTVVTLLLFGVQTDPIRHQEVTDFFVELDKGSLQAHELMLLPLLSRENRIVLNRRFPMRDTSDQAHAATAYHGGCEAIVTYDRHYQDIADRIPCLTAAEVLSRLAADE